MQKQAVVFPTYTCKIHIFNYEDAAEQHPKCYVNKAKRAGRLVYIADSSIPCA